jgi:transposase InsO family protein
MSPSDIILEFFIIKLRIKMEIISMSKKEMRRGEIIMKVLEGIITQEKASFEIGVRVRQVKRICKRCKEKGIAGLAHRNRGKPSNNRISDMTQKSIVNLIKAPEYVQFGPQLMMEQLEIRYSITVSRELVRQLMIRNGLWEVKKRKHSHYYQRRKRRQRFGELWQIDGSYHDWFEGRAPKCCLISFVDDATGRIVGALFVDHESTEDYLECMRRCISNYGLPVAVYSDRHMIFKGPKNDSQFKRALKELDIELIHANSPQAKGRIERVHGTLQDRLVKLMRLEKISSIEAGNEYLKEFIQSYNNRFGRQPMSKINAHRELSIEVDVERILCVKEFRKVSKNLEVQYENKTYQINPQGDSRRLIGKSVAIYSIKGELKIEYASKTYEYKIYKDQPYMLMDRKRIDAFLDRKKPMTAIERSRKGIALNF